MIETKFEDKFVELQSEFISLCLEVTQGAVDKIYIYLSIEENSKMFNVFFKVANELMTLNKLNISREIMMQFLELGTNDIEKVKQLCIEYQQPVPTEIKIMYSVNDGKYSASYIYEPVCTGETGITSGEIFMQWIAENK